LIVKLPCAENYTKKPGLQLGEMCRLRSCAIAL